MSAFWNRIKNKISGKVLFTVILLGVSFALYPLYKDEMPKTAAQLHQAVVSEIQSVPQLASISLITEPDDGISQLETAIKNANTSLDLIIYELEDSTIEKELVDAKNRGVAVKVILQNVNNFGNHPNQVGYEFLKNNRVAVGWSQDYFALTHQKTLIVDNKYAIIMTFNLAPQYYASSRDFAVIDSNQKDVAAISVSFDSDWSGQEKVSGNGADLVWSPGSADTLIALINSATKTLDVYNEEMADQRITAALEGSASRGVLVRVDMTYATNWKSAFNELVASGVVVRTYASTAKFYIHAKGIFVDNKEAFLGSENFSVPSLDANRELGILISNPGIISSLEKTFQKDWAGSRPFITKS